MNKFAILPFVCLLAAAPAVAQTPATTEAGAQKAPPVVKANDTVVSADGRRVGHIDGVRGASALVIYNGRFVSIPTSSFTSDGKRLTTSLTLAEIMHR